MVQKAEILELIILTVKDQGIEDVNQKVESISLIPYFCDNLKIIKRFSDLGVDAGL